MSNLIKDTTKQQRIEIIKQWVQQANEEGEIENDGIDLWDMYDDYIKGVREIAQINADLVKDYYTEGN